MQGLSQLSQQQQQAKQAEDQMNQQAKANTKQGQVGMATTGAMVGSYFGPIGTAIGAGVGFIAGSFM
ncbi:bacteriocin [Pseudomonas sp. ADAK18]|nr:bacteriocin [Pseudomonas sp. ADAK18]QJI28935.1 bacteriocin [Pseudomonas sp. ADAK18]